jgi:hypothetical protein
VRVSPGLNEDLHALARRERKTLSDLTRLTLENLVRLNPVRREQVDANV